MSRIRKIGKTLSTKDWIKYRPYNQFSSYDGYYLNLAKEVFKYLNDSKREFRQVFDREDLKEVAILLTCYYEDFINEIGLWKALVYKHKELYGWALPFYDLENYDTEYLNEEDFAYLIWHHLGTLGQKTLNPYSLILLEAANFCYDFFEERIDDSPTTNFYDTWLDISSETYFFDLKIRLNWMTFENYVTSPELNRMIKEDLQEYLEKVDNLTKGIDSDQLIYGIQNDYILKKASSWCAMTMPEWLAEVARCPEAVKTDIRQLFQRIQGLFVFERYDEHYYHYKFVASAQSFAIHRESIALDLSQLEAGETAHFCIVKWQGEWWLSGTYMAWPADTKDLDKLRFDPKYASFYAWSAEKQQSLREMTDEMDEAFISYFGKRLIIFPNEKAMSKALQDQNDWWNEHKAKKDVPTSKSSRYEKLLKEKSNKLEKLNLGSGAIAAFFNPGEGLMMSSLIPLVINLLQKESLTSKEYQELFYSFFTEFDPPLVEYIVANYPITNLQFPLFDDEDFVKEHFDFFLRYYNPSGFREVVPNLTFLPEEK